MQFLFWITALHFLYKRLMKNHRNQNFNYILHYHQQSHSTPTSSTTLLQRRHLSNLNSNMEGFVITAILTWSSILPSLMMVFMLAQCAGCGKKKKKVRRCFSISFLMTWFPFVSNFVLLSHSFTATKESEQSERSRRLGNCKTSKDTIKDSTKGQTTSRSCSRGPNGTGSDDAAVHGRYDASSQSIRPTNVLHGASNANNDVTSTNATDDATTWTWANDDVASTNATDDVTIWANDDSTSTNSTNARAAIDESNASFSSFKSSATRFVLHTSFLKKKNWIFQRNEK